MAHGLTLGSLFDGSGGFPLAGLLSGIRPVWASEIEPFPIRVTTKRLPHMKHYGDVSKISGSDIEPVDIITFGSPCQDLSVAGKREGIEQGQRSSLFFEAIRIIKEMRCATDGRYPTFIVWENVPGALSSGGGQDFRRVLEEVCGIKEADVSIPRPAKWSNAGEIVGDGFSIAWRMLDAQYWGVPQRRKRIYLVGDLAGERAGKILFESEGVRRYSPQSLKAWQRASGDTEASTGATGEDVAQMVIAFDRATYKQGQNAQYDISIQEELAQTILAQGPGGVCAPMNQCATGVDLYNASIKGKVSKTLNSAGTDSDHTPVVILNGQSAEREGLSIDPYNGAVSDTAATLGVNCGMSSGRNGIMCLNDQGVSAGFCTEESSKTRSIGYEEERSPTLRAGVVPATVTNKGGINET